MNCLETTQLENKINNLEKNKIDIDIIKELKNKNKLILKIQQRFKSEQHNDFTKEINKILSCSNEDKRIQSIDAIETYAYGTNKVLVSDKEKIKCNNIIKRYKQLLTLTML